MRKSDFVTIHVPLTPSTENLIDRAAVQKLKQGSILINTARGRIVDEQALREALDSGQLTAVGLDVIADESHPEANPLLSSERTIITPHIAFYTGESISRMFDESIRTIGAFRAGQTINPVPLEYVGKIRLHP